MVFGRFFHLLLEAIKKRNAKLASITVETRKATVRDRDGDTSGPATVSEVLWLFTPLLVFMGFETLCCYPR